MAATRSRPLLLAAGTVAPWPTTNGYALRMHHILSHLVATWDVVLITPPLPAPVPPHEQLALAEHVIVRSRTSCATLLGAADAAPFEKAMARLTERWRPAAALLWAGTEFLGFDRARWLPAVADRIDSLTLTTWRGRREARRPRDGLRVVRDTLRHATYERRLVRALAATVVVGDDDARVLERLAGRPVHVVPNGVAVGDGDGTAMAPYPTLAFTGALDYPPNVDAIRWFVEQIWPAVRATVTDARLVIAGRSPLPSVSALAEHSGIDVRADVPDMRRVLQQAWVAVAPMRTGSGIKNKVLEAWAEGRPVVMTTQATNGLTLPAEARGLIADTTAEFARRVIALLKDPARARSMGGAMRGRVCREHRWAHVAERLSDMLAGVAVRS